MIDYITTHNIKCTHSPNKCNSSKSLEWNFVSSADEWGKNVRKDTPDTHGLFYYLAGWCFALFKIPVSLFIV